MKTDQLGRGISSGKGKTAGRGTKGQKARSGYNIPTGFEGGQNPIKKRIPKLGGFKRESENIQIVNLDQINIRFKAGSSVSATSLKKEGLIEDRYMPVKILARGGKKSKKYKFSDKLKLSKAVKKFSK